MTGHPLFLVKADRTLSEGGRASHDRAGSLRGGGSALASDTVIHSCPVLEFQHILLWKRQKPIIDSYAQLRECSLS